MRVMMKHQVISSSQYNTGLRLQGNFYIFVSFFAAMPWFSMDIGGTLTKLLYFNTLGSHFNLNTTLVTCSYLEIVINGYPQSCVCLNEYVCTESSSRL